MFRAVLVAAVLNTAAGAAVLGPLATQATGKWVVNFADSQCIASRTYDVGGQEWIIGIEPMPTSTNFLVHILVPKGAPQMRNARLATGNMRISAAGMFLKGANPHSGRHYAVRLDVAEYDRLRASGLLSVTNGGQTVEFRLSNVDALQRQLNVCMADLLVKWGVSLEQQAQLASYPVPLREHYASHNDYPSSALDRWASGKATVRVRVGLDGRATNCIVEQSSGHKDLDAQTCNVYVKRARYRPARDKAGRPVEAPYVVSLEWWTA